MKEYHNLAPVHPLVNEFQEMQVKHRDDIIQEYHRTVLNLLSYIDHADDLLAETNVEEEARKVLNRAQRDARSFLQEHE